MTFSSIRKTWYSRLISLCLIVTFVVTMVITPRAQAGVMGLPMPGTMVNLSASYVPLMITGLTVHPENPLLMDFIVSTGNSGLNASQVKKESDRLIKYFLACLTIPENDQWVNLSPYEKQRIVPEDLGGTVLGQDMLAQDYLLKQLTASLIYPEKNLGKNFWDKVYAKASQMYGTTQIPVNTFNKVWILPDTAKVFEHKDTVFVVKSHLKVMLDEDYLALRKHSSVKTSEAKQSQINNLGSNIVRQIILPAIEQEVNTGKNFAQLRQIYNSMILAVWFKKNLKQALLNQVYTDKSKVNGVNADDPAIKEKIYQQYLQAYKKGVFNYIKEEVDQNNQQIIPRKYFSGGVTAVKKVDFATLAEADAALISRPADDRDYKILGLGVRIPGLTIGANPAMAAVKYTIVELEPALHNVLGPAPSNKITAFYNQTKLQTEDWPGRTPSQQIFEALRSIIMKGTVKDFNSKFTYSYAQSGDSVTINISDAALLSLPKPPEVIFSKFTKDGLDSARELFAFLPKAQGELTVTLKIGGTSIAASILNADGQFLGETSSVASFDGKGPDETFQEFLKRRAKETGRSEAVVRLEILDQVLDRMAGQIIDLVNRDPSLKNKVTLVGISSPGPFIGGGVDRKGRFSEDAVNLPYTKGLVLSNAIESRLIKEGFKNVRVEVLHDGAAGAYGERSLYGTLQNALNFAFWIWGTGIGGATISNGKLFPGGEDVHFSLGEVGHHMVRFPDGRYEWVGVQTKGEFHHLSGSFFDSYQDVEDRLGGPALAHRFGVSDPSKLKPGDIEAAGFEMGRAIGSYVKAVHAQYSIQLDHFILGSGVTNLGQPLLDAVRRGMVDEFARPIQDEWGYKDGLKQEHGNLLGRIDRAADKEAVRKALNDTYGTFYVETYLEAQKSKQEEAAAASKAMTVLPEEAHPGIKRWLTSVLKRWSAENSWDDTVAKNVLDWYSSNAVNDIQRAALIRIISESKADKIKAGFSSKLGVLQPGTAGTRGEMENLAEDKIGPNYFSTTTVIQYTLSFVNWYKSTGQTGPVFIAKEVRENSDIFGDIAARILLANGIPVIRIDKPVSTPFASYLAKWLGKSEYGKPAFGYQISASHNKFADNGIKFMGPDGQQFMPDVMNPIAAGIPSLSDVGPIPDINIMVHPQYHVLTDAEFSQSLNAYFDEIDSTLAPDVKDLIQVLIDRGKKFVFTPLNGASGEETIAYLKRFGLEEGVHYLIPPEEMKLPTDLPAAIYTQRKLENSDPAREGVLNSAIEFAEARGIDTVFARDPDGDRLVLAAKIDGEWKKLDGNQNAIVMLDDRLSHSQDLDKSKMLFMRSHATTTLLDKIASAFGVKTIVVPVGFKYFGAKIIQVFNSIVGRNFFGAEESYGTSNGHINEKDGLSGLINMLVIIARQEQVGKNVFDYLNDLYMKYGYPGDTAKNIPLPGTTKPEQDKARDNVKAALNKIKDGEKEFAGYEIVSFKDQVDVEGLGQYHDGYDLILKDKDSGKEFRLLFRPSGTEPIFKAYFSWQDPITSSSLEELQGVIANTNDFVGKVIPRLEAAFQEMAGDKAMSINNNYVDGDEDWSPVANDAAMTTPATVDSDLDPTDTVVVDQIGLRDFVDLTISFNRNFLTEKLQALTNKRIRITPVPSRLSFPREIVAIYAVHQGSNGGNITAYPMTENELRDLERERGQRFPRMYRLDIGIDHAYYLIHGLDMPILVKMQDQAMNVNNAAMTTAIYFDADGPQLGSVVQEGLTLTSSPIDNLNESQRDEYFDAVLLHLHGWVTREGKPFTLVETKYFQKLADYLMEQKIKNVPEYGRIKIVNKNFVDYPNQAMTAKDLTMDELLSAINSEISASPVPLTVEYSGKEIPDGSLGRKRALQQIVGENPNMKFDLFKSSNRLTFTDADQAQLNGGIDLNSRTLNMESSGQKINITFDPAMIAQFKRGDFSGVRIQILDVVPVNLMPLLGLRDSEEIGQLAKA